MKTLFKTAFVLSLACNLLSGCEGGQYDSSGNGAIIRETNKDDMEQLEGKDGDKVTMENTGTDQQEEHTAGTDTVVSHSGHDAQH